MDSTLIIFILWSFWGAYSELALHFKCICFSQGWIHSAKLPSIDLIDQLRTKITPQLLSHSRSCVMLVSRIENSPIACTRRKINGFTTAIEKHLDPASDLHKWWFLWELSGRQYRKCSTHTCRRKAVFEAPYYPSCEHEAVLASMKERSQDKMGMQPVALDPIPNCSNNHICSNTIHLRILLVMWVHQRRLFRNLRCLLNPSRSIISDLTITS